MGKDNKEEPIEKKRSEDFEELSIGEEETVEVVKKPKATKKKIEAEVF